MTRITLVGGIGIFALTVAGAQTIRAAFVAPRLAWIATAHQFGPVSYRDPAGAISPDGRWIAYSEGRFLRVRPIGGGAGIDFTPRDAQIRTLVWSPDSTRIAADGYSTPTAWGIYTLATGQSEPVSLRGPRAEGIRQLTWSPDGRQLAAVGNGADGNELRMFAADGSGESANPIAARIAFPAYTRKGVVGCIATENGRSRVTVPCGGAPLAAHPAADAFGPLAFSPDGSVAYAGLANDHGTVDLWAIPVDARSGAQQLSSFARDSYGPSVAADGTVAFKVQSYRTHVAVASAGGGSTQTLATFASETPSWDPTGRWLGITYGTWRRVPDDAKYPDIAQDAGIIAADPNRPAAAPATVVHDSPSEDQSLCWSPNGDWIAFHSHKDLSDDLWLRRAGDTTARRITMLGRGAETGWPRWSRDGKWILFTAASRSTRRPALFVVGVDQQSGAVREEAQEIRLDGLAIDVFHAEWADEGESLVGVGKQGPGRHLIFAVGRQGGQPRVVHRFASEHDMPGLGVSPDGRDAAFIAPAADGFFQVFRLPIAGGAPVQVTSDPSNKTQPAWSPDGQRIAFTVWNYEAQFWRIER